MIVENQKAPVSEKTVFSEDYQRLVSIGHEDSNAVIINTEWTQEGDNFKKFSLYDNNYSPVIISSSTSLISDI